MSKSKISNGAKQYFAIIFLVLMFLNLAGSAQAYPTIIEDYPLLPACKDNVDCRPGQEDFGLPEFIKYIFIFSLGVVGIIGMLALIIAAFDYVMSAGNPQKAAQGKDRITSALLGMLLLLASWVLLNMINPDLLKLGEPTEAKPVKIIVDPGEEEDECRFTQAKWNKKTINAGESATLTFVLSSKCSGITIEVKWEGLFLTQAGGAEDWIRNNRCTPMARTDDLKLSSICTFKKGDVINIKKNQPETFVLEGDLKLNDVKYNLAEKLYITVQDLKDDGTCCK